MILAAHENQCGRAVSLGLPRLAAPPISVQPGGSKRPTVCVAPATMRFLRRVSQELQAVPVIHVWYASLPSTLTLLRLDRACGMKLTNAGARMQVRGRLCWERGRGAGGGAIRAHGGHSHHRLADILTEQPKAMTLWLCTDRPRSEGRRAGLGPSAASRGQA